MVDFAKLMAMTPAQRQELVEASDREFEEAMQRKRDERRSVLADLQQPFAQERMRESEQRFVAQMAALDERAGDTPRPGVGGLESITEAQARYLVGLAQRYCSPPEPMSRAARFRTAA